MARRNLPLAAADAVEWGSRRLDIAVLGLFFSPAIVGIYYVAQNVASLPSKLKTSFDPILGPVIARNVAKGDKAAVARQVRQVGFWVIAAQLGVALALGIPGEGVMGLVGPAFVAGTGALAILLAAEVVAAMAAVSESALIYVARHRNMLLSLAMIVLQAVLSVALILVMRELDLSLTWQATGRRWALLLALAFAAVAKSRLLVPTARATGVGLALAAGVGGGGGGRRRHARHPAARMGGAAVRHPGDPARVRRWCCGPAASAPRTASCSG